MVKVKVKTLSGYTGLRLPGATYNESAKRAAWLMEKGLVDVIEDETGKDTAQEKKAVKTAKNAPKTKTTVSKAGRPKKKPVKKS